MAWLSKLAARGARAAGRSLATHVVPDSLIPSWKTRQVASTGYALLKKATRKAGKKKKPKPGSSSPARGAARPAPRAPKKKFDRNSWSMGRSMRPPAEYAESRPSPSKSLSSGLGSSLARRGQQVRDVVREPRAAMQMGLDFLDYEYQVKKRSFLSNFKRPV